LGLIASVGAGYEGIDVAHARARGIEVTNGAGINSDDVADLAMALLLTSVCGIKEGECRVREGRWTEIDRGPRRRSLKERRVGIVGLGRIGRAIAERLVPFRCSIRWYGPNPKPDVPWPRAATLIELARDSDVLIVAALLSESTANLIDGSIIHALGSDGILVNVARGGLVDEHALIAALRSGELGAAALDVYAEEPTSSSKWEGVPNVVLTPHLGGYATAAMSKLGELLRENLQLFFAGKRVLTPVP
jgi:lactate dehydrogenase-like 2-hydroxyacid dehydrogenase